MVLLFNYWSTRLNVHLPYSFISMIIYPDKPWSDGQTFVHTPQAGDDIAGITKLLPIRGSSV